MGSKHNFFEYLLRILYEVYSKFIKFTCRICTRSNDEKQMSKLELLMIPLLDICGNCNSLIILWIIMII